MVPTATTTLCIRDATDTELVRLIHPDRQSWGTKRNLGPFTMQQAICLYLAARVDYSETRMKELEDIARQEDFASFQRHGCNVPFSTLTASSGAHNLSRPSITQHFQALAKPDKPYFDAAPASRVETATLSVQKGPTS